MRGRIALCVPEFPKTSETFIVSQFLGLLSAGWDVHVVAGQGGSPDVSRFPELERRAVRGRIHEGWPHRPRWLAALLTPLAIARCAALRPRTFFRYLRIGWGRFGVDVLRRAYLDAELIALAPDLVHFEFGAIAAERTYLGDLLGCRLVVSFRGYDLNFVGLDRPDHYASVWRDADGIHCLGRDLWNRAMRRGCPPDKLHFLIPPAIDVSYFTPGEEGSGERPCFRVLSVGRLEWKKGYEDALLAVRRLVDAGVPCEYRIVGEGDHAGAVGFAVHQLGLEGVVRLIGAVGRDGVRRELREADAFLHAAVSEGFCNAVLEAQASGLPVVCTDADGLSENVRDGETGFVVGRRDAEALADRLERLARDPALRRRMGSAGRRRVEREFRSDAQIAAFSDLYERVLTGRAPSAEEIESTSPVARWGRAG